MGELDVLVDEELARTAPGEDPGLRSASPTRSSSTPGADMHGDVDQRGVRGEIPPALDVRKCPECIDADAG